MEMAEQVNSATSRCTKSTFFYIDEGTAGVLVAEKLGAAGLALLWEFANVDCSYDLSPEGLRAKISLCEALVVRSGTNVGSDVFEAFGVRLRIVGQVGVGIGIGNGYLVVNAPIANTVTAAEDGIALMCAMARNVAQADASRGCAPWPGRLPRPHASSYEKRSLVIFV
ncbi:hypothetical protein ZWY2020_001920 [Hordeum vulgare]|nr:hypothetical protein ZWY2020_001920 [Hordeum vulgare]